MLTYRTIDNSIWGLRDVIKKVICSYLALLVGGWARRLVSKTPHTLFRVVVYTISSSLGVLSRAQGDTVGNSSYFPHISDTNKYCRAVNKASGLKLRPYSEG
eukprot:sb/3478376/